MAFGRKKGFTAKQSARMSARMNSNMVGTHVRSNAQSTRRRNMNASSVSFSDSRRANRAVRGEVDAFVPRTSTRESAASHRQRVNQRQYAKQIQRKSHARTIVTTVVVAVAVVAIAVGAGVFTYNSLIGNSTGLSDSDAKSALVAPTEGKPFYALIAVELGSTSASLANNGPDVLLLARVDTSSKNVTFVSLPANLQVTYDGQTVQLANVDSSGDKALISAVAEFAGVDVGHYIKLTEGQLVSLVDKIGGVDLDLSQEIDDPNAGDIYIPSGEQTLSGQQAVVLQRATNVADGSDGQRANQVKFASALFAKLFSSSFTATLSDISEFFQTDMSTSDMTSVASKLSGMSEGDFTSVEVPGSESSKTSLDGGTVTYFVPTSSSWTQIMSELDEGNTSAGKSSVETVDPGSFTIEVQNGASITGAASATTQKLTNLGFKVEKSGNADQQIYEQTLVIYDNDQGLQQAQTVINALGIGRAVKGQGYYEYDTNILVILGGDYKPTS